MRVSLDAGALVSAFATRALCSDVLHTVLAEHDLVLGETILSELARVQRTKFGTPDELAHETLAVLRRDAPVTSGWLDPEMVPRDPHDTRVLGEAPASEADVLVTGDRDQLDVAEKPPADPDSARIPGSAASGRVAPLPAGRLAHFRSGCRPGYVRGCPPSPSSHPQTPGASP